MIRKHHNSICDFHICLSSFAIISPRKREWVVFLLSRVFLWLFVFECLLLAGPWVGPGSLVEVFLAILTYLSLLNEGIVTTRFKIM